MPTETAEANPISAPAARRVARVVDLPAPAQGSFGPHHQAVAVFGDDPFAATDPFIVLQDDRADGTPIGGPHPHAGLETVTLVLQGSFAYHDSIGKGVLRAGDAQWMTAGRGIVHGEATPPGEPLRVLQLWVTLPRRDRWAPPAHQDVRATDAPLRKEPGAEVRLYSGSSGGLRSPTHTAVPMTLADVRLEPGAGVEQDLPASYNGFLYVLEGEALVGADDTPLQPGQVGWLDRPARRDTSTLRLSGGPRGAHLLLYAGEPQHEPILSYGPFIAHSREDLVRLLDDYRAGRFPALAGE
jgi:redox-sensitive bicupin YhaK (pirin superfamily)